MTEFIDAIGQETRRRHPLFERTPTVVKKQTRLLLPSKKTIMCNFIENEIKNYPNLNLKINQGDIYRIMLSISNKSKSKGSLWITPTLRKLSYRVQTTGIAQQLDLKIQNWCGREADGWEKPQLYQFWKDVEENTVKLIIKSFANLK